MSVPLVDLLEWRLSNSDWLISILRAAESSRAERSALLEAFAAKNRTPLRGTEGDSRFLSALGARGLRFRAHLGGATAAATTFGALGFAALAPFRLVLESLVGEKHLFAGSKYKFSAAFRTLQDPIVVFHEPLSRCPKSETGDGHISQ